jgi:integrase/recombinase XerD
MAKLKMLKTVENVTISEGFKDFLTSCDIKNLSPATIQSYKNHFKKFEYYVDSSNLYDISQSVVDNYILHLKSTTPNITSINTNLRHIRAILNYFSTTYNLPPISIKLLKVQEKVKDCYTEEELSVLLKKPNTKTCNFTEYRNWVMTSFLVATGCRIGSLVNIRLQDVDLDNGLAVLSHTKNKKPQIVALPHSLIPILKDYIKVRGGTGEDYLFCNETGAYFNSTSASHALADYNRARGIKKTSAHLYRHTFAKNFVLSGGSLHALQKQLGHNTLAMSLKYCNLYDQDFHKGMEQFNLFEKIKQTSNKLKMK